MKKIPVLLLASVLMSGFSTLAMSEAEFVKRPKLVVVISIDQFRADYLTRFEDRFLAPGTSAKPGGFRYLTRNGAYFPFAEYDVLQAMTCPGHSTILTGSWPATHGIGINEWFDPKIRKIVYCVDDPVDGISPRRLRTTTVGDELKNVKPDARVFTVSLKDRAAVMLGGHHPDMAVWMDDKKMRWTTSTYYSPKAELPAWAREANAGLEKLTREELDPTKPAGAAKGTAITLELAADIVKREKLGRGKSTDLLGVSLSTHDILGHALGPNSKEMEKLTLEEDQALARFLQALRKDVGSLDDVVIVLTADHGTPPTVETAKNAKIDSGRYDSLAAIKHVDARLDEKFGSPGNKEWIIGSRYFNYFLNDELIASKKLNATDVQAEAKKAFLDEPGILNVLTRAEYEKQILPAGKLTQQIRNSYVLGQSGDLVIIAKPFFYEKGSNFVTHMTGWSYDRTVPMIFVGRAFKPGVYPGGQVVDLASTLSFVMGVLPPAMSEGRVLGEALK